MATESIKPPVAAAIKVRLSFTNVSQLQIQVCQENRPRRGGVSPSYRNERSNKNLYLKILDESNYFRFQLSFRKRGLTNSFNPSPTNDNPTTMTVIAKPGNNAVHQIPVVSGSSA